jgi:NDP-sugar pyrophosphorylase family protein
MLAVILAAGEGQRMRPLTLELPKPLLPIGGKPILEHVIDVLPSEITEIIIVTGYKGDLIQNYFGELYKGTLITYVHQDEQKGTFDALLKVKEQLSDKLAGRFLLLNADDLHGGQALAEATQSPLALLVARHEDPTKFGVVTTNEDGTLKDIQEKPQEKPKIELNQDGTVQGALVSTGAMVLDEKIFKYDVKPATNGELYLPEALRQLATETPVQVIEQKRWFPIGYPEDLVSAERFLNS